MPLSERAKKLGQEPAFPYAIEHGTEAWSGGMTKREYLAALSMQGLAACSSYMEGADVAASTAVCWADSLLEQLAKDGG